MEIFAQLWVGKPQANMLGIINFKAHVRLSLKRAMNFHMNFHFDSDRKVSASVCLASWFSFWQTFRNRWKIDGNGVGRMEEVGRSIDRFGQLFNLRCLTLLSIYLFPPKIDFLMVIKTSWFYYTPLSSSSANQSGFVLVFFDLLWLELFYSPSRTKPVRPEC